MDFSNKNILLTQIRLHDFAGSEIITLEMAEYFSSKNANVTILTHTYGSPIAEEFNRLPNVTVFVTNEDTISTYLANNTVDLVWVHHQLIPVELIGSTKTKFIFHHMSPYVELESPMFWRIEENLADIILFNSEETKEKLLADGYFKNCEKKLVVFGNPSPDVFFYHDEIESGDLKNVLVVSNHPPEEIADALNILTSRGVSVETLGFKSEKYVRITPSNFKDYDVVITIGKTVQYSIATRTSVYCYDHFGGPGYLNTDNYQKAKELNFSGRGFTKKSGVEIANEILEGYITARNFARTLSVDKMNDLSLERRMEYISDMLNKKPVQSVKKLYNKQDVMSYVSLMNVIERNVRGLKEVESGEIQHLKVVNVNTTTKLDQLKIELNNITSKYNEILVSRPYKFTSRVFSILRTIKRWLKGN